MWFPCQIKHHMAPGIRYHLAFPPTFHMTRGSVARIIAADTIRNKIGGIDLDQNNSANHEAVYRTIENDDGTVNLRTTAYIVLYT